VTLHVQAYVGCVWRAKRSGGVCWGRWEAWSQWRQCLISPLPQHLSTTGLQHHPHWGLSFTLAWSLDFIIKWGETKIVRSDYASNKDFDLSIQNILYIIYIFHTDGSFRMMLGKVAWCSDWLGQWRIKQVFVDVICLWPAGGNLGGIHVTVWYLTICPFQVRRKRPTRVILENMGCEFTLSWKTALTSVLIGGISKCSYSFIHSFSKHKNWQNINFN
jgi:hypothetical protein